MKHVLYFSCFLFLLGPISACSNTNLPPESTPDKNPHPTCNICHGSEINNAPPFDTLRNEKTSFRGVGAHQNHLFEPALIDEIPCEECHLVPSDPEDEGHRDSELPAEIVFGELSKSGELSPSWDGKTCQNVYCHGTTLSGGSNKTPTWIRVGKDEAACGSCHGIPPLSVAPHTPGSPCNFCHSSTVGSDDCDFDLGTDTSECNIIEGSTHIDGVVDVNNGTSCKSCHGTPGESAAPPTDLSGGSSRSLLGVGAHRTHLEGERWSSTVACSSCHQVPSDINDSGHLDTSPPAEVIFGGMADAEGANPVWDREAGTCRDTYCHGATLLEGGSVPIWNSVEGNQADCGTCHSLPPPFPHVGREDCENCHSEVAGPSLTIVEKSKHIDGQLQVDTMECYSCHGSGIRSDPPLDTLGNTDTSFRGVGAHRAHSTDSGAVARPLACPECHKIPSSNNAVDHRDTPLPAEVTFNTRARSYGASPVWNGTSCSGTYCHGATLSGGTNTSPTWTLVDGSQIACGSCHGTPPLTGKHNLHQKKGLSCSKCHDGAGVSGSGTPLNHVNAVFEVQFDSENPSGAYDSGSQSCSSLSCHSDKNW